MKRVEVIANQELLTDFLQKLEEDLPDQYYTIFDVMRGKGKSGEARGDGIWPERNFYCIMFTPSVETLRALHKIALVLKHDNPANAFVMFVSDAQILQIRDLIKQEDEQKSDLQKDPQEPLDE